MAAAPPLAGSSLRLEPDEDEAAVASPATSSTASSSPSSLPSPSFGSSSIRSRRKVSAPHRHLLSLASLDAVVPPIAAAHVDAADAVEQAETTSGTARRLLTRVRDMTNRLRPTRSSSGDGNGTDESEHRAVTSVKRHSSSEHTPLASASSSPPAPLVARHSYSSPHSLSSSFQRLTPTRSAPAPNRRAPAATQLVCEGDIGAALDISPLREGYLRTLLPASSVAAHRRRWRERYVIVDDKGLYIATLASSSSSSSSSAITADDANGGAPPVNGVTLHATVDLIFAFVAPELVVERGQSCVRLYNKEGDCVLLGGRPDSVLREWQRVIDGVCERLRRTLASAAMEGVDPRDVGLLVHRALLPAHTAAGAADRSPRPGSPLSSVRGIVRCGTLRLAPTWKARWVVLTASQLFVFRASTDSGSHKTAVTLLFCSAKLCAASHGADAGAPAAPAALSPPPSPTRAAAAVAAAASAVVIASATTASPAAAAAAATAAVSSSPSASAPPSLDVCFDLFNNEKSHGTLRFAANRTLEATAWVNDIQRAAASLMLELLGGGEGVEYGGGDDDDEDEATTATTAETTTATADTASIAADASAASPPAFLRHQAPHLQTRIAALLTRSAQCADCGARAPRWLIINHGALVCLACAGIHRSLGTHVSKVRSLELDVLSDAAVAVAEAAGGNDAVNARLAAAAADAIDEASSYEAKRAFIEAKYSSAASSSSPPPPTSTAKTSATKKKKKVSRRSSTSSVAAAAAAAAASSTATPQRRRKSTSRTALK